MPQKDPCKLFACRIQACLSAHDYQESACQEALEDMRQCCIKWGTASYVCGGIKTTEPSQISNKSCNENKKCTQKTNLD